MIAEETLSKTADEYCKYLTKKSMIYFANGRKEEAEGLLVRVQKMIVDYGFSESSEPVQALRELEKILS